jgi:prolyl-tRNA editing enzyme YbaK/EbsC (Cys-tRNA(Pro) deacylase)
MTNTFELPPTSIFDHESQRKTLLIEENEKIACEIFELTKRLDELLAKLDSNCGRPPRAKMLPRKKLSNMPEQSVAAS